MTTIKLDDLLRKLEYGIPLQIYVQISALWNKNQEKIVFETLRFYYDNNFKEFKKYRNYAIIGITIDNGYLHITIYKEEK